MDVNAIDVTGAPAELAVDLEVAAAGNLKRIVRRTEADWLAEPSTKRLLSVVETKTVWHPIGV